MIFEKKIAEAYRATAYTRCDDDGTARYFSAADFEGLSCHHYPFSAKAGHKLSGYIYSYDGAKENRLLGFQIHSRYSWLTRDVTVCPLQENRVEFP